MTREEALAEICRANAEGRPAYLVGADLHEANLSGVNLCGAYMPGANLVCANLAGAILASVNLCRANLRGANLRRAILAGAILCGTNLDSAYLDNANLVEANFGGLRIVARATRSDGYEYFAWTSILGGLVIRAGCRTWTSFAEAREHCRTETDEKYRAEALRIIDYLEVCYDAT